MFGVSPKSMLIIAVALLALAMFVPLLWLRLGALLLASIATILFVVLQFNAISARYRARSTSEQKNVWMRNLIVLAATSAYLLPLFAFQHEVLRWLMPRISPVLSSLGARPLATGVCSVIAVLPAVFISRAAQRLAAALQSDSKTDR
jgi:hypothetical protein